MHKVELMTRKGCHLCEEMQDVLLRVRQEHPFELMVRDIDEDEALRAAYDREVPVLLIDGRKLARYRVDEAALLRRLARPEAEGG